MPVRLALFAEMIKGKTWTPATLREVGGTGRSRRQVSRRDFQLGAVVTQTPLPPGRRPGRLEGAAARNKRRHQGPDAVDRRTARDLRLWRSGRRLQRADPHARQRPPPDHAGRPRRGHCRAKTPRHPPPGGRSYQLTHDYLVQSLREWLTRKQRETRRGRAQTLLADAPALWTSKPARRDTCPR